MRALPSIQGLWEGKQEKGLLHVFLVESQGGTKADLETYARERNLTFPIAIRNECDFSEYTTPGGLPYAMVIGPDGKVVWEGRSGYESVIEAQIERIKYPGLGKLEVHNDCVRAATFFGTGEFGRAKSEAEKVLERKSDEEAAVTDAQFIIDAVEAKVESMNAAVDAAVEKKRYHDAVRILEELEGRAFRGMDEAQEAAEKRREELESDDKVKEELKAWQTFERTLSQLERVDDARRKATLENFAKRYEGTAAAAEATSMADGISVE